MLNRASAPSAMTFGIPGLFTPRFPPPFLSPDGSMAALSYYDTQPLNATLEALVDFDLINKGLVRLSPRCRSAPITYWRAARCRRGFGEEVRGSLHRVLKSCRERCYSIRTWRGSGRRVRAREALIVARRGFHISLRICPNSSTRANTAIAVTLLCGSSQ
jgi:hypothetical protein